MATFQIGVLWWSAQWRTPGNPLLAKARRWMMPRPGQPPVGCLTVTEYNDPCLGDQCGGLNACASQRFAPELDGPPAFDGRGTVPEMVERGGWLSEISLRTYLSVIGGVNRVLQVNHLRGTALWLEEGVQ